MLSLVVFLTALVVSDVDMRLCLGAGYCFWEKTSNACKAKNEKFEYDAYNFYAVCRSGDQPNAEFQCLDEPAKLDADKCRERATSTITFSAYCIDCEQSMCICVLSNLAFLRSFTA